MGDSVTRRKELLASEARTASENSNPVSIPPDAKNVGIAMKTTAYTSGTFTAKLQHSIDGTSWTDVTGATTTAVGATGDDIGFASVPVLGLVRAVLTGASTPSATQQVLVIYT